ncbi:BRCT domain protein [Metarhizium robertsii]|uniref:BRCT domain protein n=1 Tax=Metarhizium robertsii TaxID=568076 RepID=A0A014PHZ8_9HYPO|nr:BRCT domain protein [Metarhizium robertsii]
MAVVTRRSLARKALPTERPRPLKSYSIVFCGRFGGQDRTHIALRSLVLRLGGSVPDSVKLATHIVCTGQSYNSQERKMKDARALMNNREIKSQLKFVTPQWVEAVANLQKGSDVDPDNYLWNINGNTAKVDECHNLRLVGKDTTVAPEPTAQSQ